MHNEFARYLTLTRIYYGSIVRNSQEKNVNKMCARKT